VTADHVLRGSYDYWLVALSVGLATLAAYTSLDLAGQLGAAKGRIRSLWLLTGAFALGMGIWGTQCVGLEAWRLPTAVTYHWPSVALALVAAVLTSACALSVVGRETATPRLMVLGSMVMGLGIALMHCIGVRSMQLNAVLVYSLWEKVLGILLTIMLSFLVLRLIFFFKQEPGSVNWRKLASALLIGFAIAGMHYPQMHALSFVRGSGSVPVARYAVSRSSLGLGALVLSTVAILGLVCVGALMSRLMMEKVARRGRQARTIFNHLRDGIVVIDREQKIVELNRAAQSILGLPEGLESIDDQRACIEISLPSRTGQVPVRWRGILSKIVPCGSSGGAMAIARCWS
jgi:NO-binding membrane sensor protein with MHYT domain